MSILIKNGRVIDPDSRLDEICDVLIENGKIAKVEKEISGKEARVIDAKGCYVMPGLIDMHVHFRDPGLTYKEDIETGAASAKAGGFTTVVMMANTKPVIDNEETLRYVLEKGSHTGIHVLSAANITRGMKGKELINKKIKKLQVQLVYI